MAIAGHRPRRHRHLASAAVTTNQFATRPLRPVALLTRWPHSEASSRRDASSSVAASARAAAAAAALAASSQAALTPPTPPTPTRIRNAPRGDTGRGDPCSDPSSRAMLGPIPSIFPRRSKSTVAPRRPRRRRRRRRRRLICAACAGVSTSTSNRSAVSGRRPCSRRQMTTASTTPRKRRRRRRLPRRPPRWRASGTPSAPEPEPAAPTLIAITVPLHPEGARLTSHAIYRHFLKLFHAFYTIWLGFHSDAIYRHFSKNVSSVWLLLMPSIVNFLKYFHFSAFCLVFILTPSTVIFLKHFQFFGWDFHSHAIYRRFSKTFPGFFVFDLIC